MNNYICPEFATDQVLLFNLAQGESAICRRNSLYIDIKYIGGSKYKMVVIRAGAAKYIKEASLTETLKDIHIFYNLKNIIKKGKKK